MKENYNGFTNRSTWLARLWLENTSPEVYGLAKQAADTYMRLHKETVESSGYSYPAWQLRGNEKAAEELLKEKTMCYKEENFRASDIHWPEVFTAIAGI